KEYWEVSEKYPALQGGYIGDWVDQGVYKEVDGGKIFSYRGDWGPEDATSDNNFLINGDIMTDRTCNHHAYEVRKVHQEIGFDFNEETAELEIFNKYFFRDLSNFNYEVKLLKNGEVISTGALETISLSPRNSSLIPLPFNIPEDTLAEYRLHV